MKYAGRRGGWRLLEYWPRWRLTAFRMALVLGCMHGRTMLAAAQGMPAGAAERDASIVVEVRRQPPVAANLPSHLGAARQPSTDVQAGIATRLEQMRQRNGAHGNSPPMSFTPEAAPEPPSQ